jgi:tRNA threonylcarbamoyl adenosine modification protein YeaZ
MSTAVPLLLPALALSGSNADARHAFSTAVRTCDGIVTEIPLQGQRGDLACLTQLACKRAGIAMRDLQSIVIDRGPGSYIGLRVAVTFARTLCTFAGPRLFVTDTLQLIAAAALAGDPSLASNRIITLLDGRKGSVHLGIHQKTGGQQLAMITKPCAMPLDQLPLQLLCNDTILCAAPIRSRIEPMATAAMAKLLALPIVHAGHLFDPSLGLENPDLNVFEPLYLMGSYVD